MSTAALIGKGPSLDHIDWAAVNSECGFSMWINETFLAAPKLGARVDAVIGQDREALDLFLDHTPAGVAIFTQQSQYHGGGLGRFSFRQPWFEFADKLGSCASPQGYSTAANAICVIAELLIKGERVDRLHLIGFDGLNWDRERWDAGMIYANCIKDLKWYASEVPHTKYYQAYEMVCDQVREAIAYTGLEIIDHALENAENCVRA